MPKFKFKREQLDEFAENIVNQQMRPFMPQQSPRGVVNPLVEAAKKANQSIQPPRVPKIGGK